jgi:hypothetical protein
MLLRAVQVQGPTLVSVADAKACVQTLAEMQERSAHASRRLTVATIVLVAACSVAAVLGAVAVTVAWAAGELSADAVWSPRRPCAGRCGCSRACWSRPRR